MASKTVQLEEKVGADEFVNLIPAVVKNSPSVRNPTTAVYGVRIDTLDQNPETAVVYTDDAIGYTPARMNFNNGQFNRGTWGEVFPFNQIRPCLLKNGELITYLNPNNFAEDINGNNVSLTGESGDVMIEIPKIYYCIYKDGNYQYIKISKKRYAGFCCLAHTYKGVEKDFIYIGAYQGTIDNDKKLRSISGGTGTNSESDTRFSENNQAGLNKFREAAHNHKDNNNISIEGYEELWWHPLVLLQALFTIQFRSLNSQAVMGYGWVNNSSGASTCGGLNDKGMNYCASGTTNAQMKWLGIEDFWGSRQTWIDGAYLAGSTTDTNKTDLKVVNPNNDMNFGYVNGYETIAMDLVKAEKCIKNIVGDNKSGFCPSEFVNIDYNKYFCDFGLLAENTIPSFGGDYNSQLEAGAFYMKFNNMTTNNNNFFGGRLFYCPINSETFSKLSWERINNIAQNGYARQYFNIGDEKTITLSDGEVITLQILGFDHDELVGGGNAKMTIGMKNLLMTEYKMNNAFTNAGGWHACLMRTSTMPEYYNKLPADLKSVIKMVKKDTTRGNMQTTIQTSHDNLFLFSWKELSNTTSAGYVGEGTQYEYWSDNNTANDRIKKRLINGTWTANWWWLRSPHIGIPNNFHSILSNGDYDSSGASYAGGVCFGFCI